MSPATPFQRLAIIVPTRNRAALALNAVQSALREPDPRLSVLVSDNSTDPAERAALERQLHDCSDSRVHYVRPPEPLAMGPHWEWAIRQAEVALHPTHISFLTDRMVYKSGELHVLLQLAERHPNRLISYNHDRIEDLGKPVTLIQESWTGKALELPSRAFLVDCLNTGWSAPLPRLLNVLAPVSVFAQTRARYGDVCDSTHPDMCFAIRALERESSFIYFDRCPLVHYALARSNGASMSRGERTKDHEDFLRTVGDRGINHAAPIPGLPTVLNSIYHEYCRVRAETGASLPEPNLFVYFDSVSDEVDDMRNATLQRQLRERIDAEYRRHVASGTLGAHRRSARLYILRKKLTLHYARNKVAKTLLKLKAPDALRARLLEFPDSETARAHACEHARAPRPGTAGIEYGIREARIVDMFTTG